MGLRQIVRRAGGRPLASYRRRRQDPVLTVVMPVYNVAEYLPAALDSALSQTLKSLEVIAVDDGSTDDCPRILRDYTRRDYRVRVLSQANAGQGEARNLAVQHARGEFLTFLDSDDVVPPAAYEAMVDGLRASGSDFAVGNLRRLRHGQLQRIIWSRTVHRRDRLATTIEEFPDAMQDIIACNRMFRTGFWREQVGGFRGAGAYEDHVPMLTAYVRARSFDVLQRVTYHWRIREDLTSTGQQKARIDNLRDRIKVLEEAHALLRAEASDEVYAAWVGRALEVDFPPFLPFALTGDDDYRALLAETYRTFLDRVSPAGLAQVRVAMRVRAHLAAQERWEDLLAADDWLRQVQNMPPTTASDGQLVADFPAECTWADALPPDQRWMAPLECHFEAAVEHLEWSPSRLRITGWAWLRGLDMRSPTISAWLSDGTQRLPVDVRQLRLPEADEWGPLSHASPADGGFVAAVDLEALGTASRRSSGVETSWSFALSVEQDGLTSEGVVLHRVAHSAAAAPSSGSGVAVRWDASEGLMLDVGGDSAAAGYPEGLLDVGLTDGRLRMTVSGHAGDVRLEDVDKSLATPEVTSVDGGVRITADLALDGRAVPSGTYELTDSETHVPLERGFAGTAPRRLAGADVHVEVGQRRDHGAVVVVSAPLRDDERGAVNVHRQRTRYRSLATPVSDAVLLGCDDGLAGGDQLALDRWLAEHRPDVPRLWGLPDRSAEVPEGALGLLRGSREWYDALATARLVAHDGDLGPWVSRRDGQRILRTFAAHPFEPLGVGAWLRDGMIEHLVNREVHHRHQEWEVLLAPSEVAADRLREAFRWEGEVLVAGSPRTDRIVTADRDVVRQQVLAQLGVPESTLVLHAPAARDGHDVAGPAGADGLDVAALARELGPGFTVLHRRDPSDRRPRPDLTGVVDVSRFADLASLVIAADVAVLDYSGVRFDWALTGRPAIFHVPDLEEWTRHRSTLFPWKETAPGAWVHGYAGAAACVGEAATLEETYADEVAAFNARFNAMNDGGASRRVLSALLP